jgi:hypothetical protein
VLGSSGVMMMLMGWGTEQRHTRLPSAALDDGSRQSRMLLCCFYCCYCCCCSQGEGAQRRGQQRQRLCAATPANHSDRSASNCRSRRAMTPVLAHAARRSGMLAGSLPLLRLLAAAAAMLASLSASTLLLRGAGVGAADVACAGVRVGCRAATLDVACVRMYVCIRVKSPVSINGINAWDVPVTGCKRQCAAEQQEEKKVAPCHYCQLPAGA